MNKVKALKFKQKSESKKDSWEYDIKEAQARVAKWPEWKKKHALLVFSEEKKCSMD